MKTTFTVTFHHTTNYGATLQAYALQQVVRSLGYENTLFEYPCRSLNVHKKPLIQRLKKNVAKLLYGNIFSDEAHARLTRSFQEFHQNRMNFSRVYESLEDLRENCPYYDYLITGSDQVWRASDSIFFPAYFLDFGSERSKRFSYAASLESLNYSEALKETVKGFLAKFQGISLREESARKYFSEFTGRQAVRVLDPVYLLDVEQWASISQKPRMADPCILVYQVVRNPRMQEVVDTLKKRTGLPIVSICKDNKYIRSDYAYYDVSPEEFLGFYQNAAIVAAASFHGTSFGLLFNKPTYSLLKSTAKNRAREVMSLFGQERFCIDSNSEIPDPVIDAQALSRKISEEREKSLAYLKEQLEYEPQ